jgi:colanic acid/amylovoran biosynthesis glycosyltransferase
MIERLKEFDIFLFCHKTPESPRCLIEALMCGLPIIGYDSPYPKDLIHGNGGGILTPPNDPRALSAALLTVSPTTLRGLTYLAQQDGIEFSTERVFKHRSDLMKEIA